MNIQVDPRNLEEIIKELLEHIVPETEEKVLLNEITDRQIVNSTYIENTRPSNSSDTNILVPHSLYECKTNQAWRYPPYMTVDFLVRKANKITLKIKGGFGVARFLEYGEHRKFGKSIQKRYITNPSIKTPHNFSKVTLEDKEYDLKEEESFRIKSIVPIFYEFEEEIVTTKTKRGTIYNEKKDINESKTIIKKYDEFSDKEVSALSEGKIVKNLDYERINGSTDRDRTKVAYIKLTSGPLSFKLLVSVEDEPESEEFVRFTIRLINVQEYRKPNPKESEWRKLSLLIPYFFIQIKDTEVKIPPQQYVEVLRERLAEKDESVGKKLLKESLESYNNTNCILTRSIDDAQTLVCTTFGVYDTIREKPVWGPKIDFLLANKQNLVSELNIFEKSEIEKILSNTLLLETLNGILNAIRDQLKSDGIETPKLYKYQWEAIQRRIKLLLEGQKGTTTIIKAPTGTGKTIVFMANAALHSLITGERAVLMFPTRILNEDMFKRLTYFIFALRKHLKNEKITGGIFIGSSDPLYKAVANPKPGEQMIQYKCPQCDIYSIFAHEDNNKIIGVCKKCGHKIDYMYGVNDVCAYLPLITIATPDKLFYEATAKGYEGQIKYDSLRFFGGNYVRCNCGYCIPAMDKRKDRVECPKCNSMVNVRRNNENSPIGYFVFDEVHSLYGITATLISIFLKTLNLMYNKIVNPNYRKESLRNKPTFESGTATIANEIELLAAITRCSRDEIYSFPDDKEYHKYFEIDENHVRYRTLVMLPVAKATRTAISNALIETYMDLHKNTDLKSRLQTHFSDPNLVDSFDFLLGYVYYKRDGYTLRRTLYDSGRQRTGEDLNVEFLSGDFPNSAITKIFESVSKKEIDILLANLVISLGIDIKSLNNIIMMGIPKTMIELIQTAGRTGRGKMPGHVTVYLLPSNPRDTHLYENFHIMLSDVKGYLEEKPAQSTNAYAAQIILPNVVESILAAESCRPYSYCLTAPSFRKYIDQDNRRIDLILSDIMSVLIEDDTPKALKQEIYKIVAENFRYYINEWNKLSGLGRYISSWFQDRELILTSLRERTARDVKVSVNDRDLYELIEKQQKKPWVKRLITFDEEAVDEDYENLVEGD